MATYDKYKEAFTGIPKPFAFVDLDKLDDNARAIAKAAGDKKVRLASKSIRSVDVLRRLLNIDPAFQGIMCYTAGEAAFLAKQGFDDLLLGYPQWEPGAIAELITLIQEGRTIVFMVDSITHVRQIERLAEERKVHVPIPLCLDLDMSSDYPGLHFGVWRSPLQSAHQLLPVADYIIRSPWLKLDGLMGYEAQIAGVGDNAPGNALKNGIVRMLQKRSVRLSARRRGDAVEQLNEALKGETLRFVNAGGTGSMDSSRLEPWVTEITAGSGFYSPGLFDNYKKFRYKPAAGYAVEVIRRPRADIVTCMGGGYTASGPIAADKQVKPYLPEGLKLFSLEGAGEVQTPLLVPPGLQLEPGDPVFFRHAKAGELCERFTKLYAVSQGRVVDEYATYRGMGECFL
ncbi:amino acid deaminase/aldolase [Paenibacillus sp. NPDC058071]|uniref:amino acid deaminase/aldolase n=1 Tax=Paenibacillus sp. NPDC058071 TaxID=3346326 RepID=UPI0036DA4274